MRTMILVKKALTGLFMVGIALSITTCSTLIEDSIPAGRAPLDLDEDIRKSGAIVSNWQDASALPTAGDIQTMRDLVAGLSAARSSELRAASRLDDLKAQWEEFAIQIEPRLYVYDRGESTYFVDDYKSTSVKNLYNRWEYNSVTQQWGLAQADIDAGVILAVDRYWAGPEGWEYSVADTLSTDNGGASLTTAEYRNKVKWLSKESAEKRFELYISLYTQILVLSDELQEFLQTNPSAEGNRIAAEIKSFLNDNIYYSGIYDNVISETCGNADKYGRYWNVGDSIKMLDRIVLKMHQQPTALLTPEERISVAPRGMLFEFFMGNIVSRPEFKANDPNMPISNATVDSIRIIPRFFIESVNNTVDRTSTAPLSRSDVLTATVYGKNDPPQAVYWSISESKLPTIDSTAKFEWGADVIRIRPVNTRHSAVYTRTVDDSNATTFYDAYVHVNTLELQDSLIIRAHSMIPGYAHIYDSVIIPWTDRRWPFAWIIAPVKESAFASEYIGSYPIRQNNLSIGWYQAAVVPYPHYDENDLPSLTMELRCAPSPLISLDSVRWSVEALNVATTLHVIDAQTGVLTFDPADQGDIITSAFVFHDGKLSPDTARLRLQYAPAPPYASNGLNTSTPWHFLAGVNHPATGYLPSAVSYIPRSKREKMLAGYRRSFPNVCRQRNQFGRLLLFPA